MDKNNIINEYFEWMTNIVCGKRFSGKMTYKKLLSCLHMITFRCEIRSDENRAEDGVEEKLLLRQQQAEKIRMIGLEIVSKVHAVFWR